MIPPACSPKSSTALFFKHNTALGPPYQILVDTNFINFSITNKLDIFKGMMDCLLAKCIPILTDCVMAELEKLGTRYRVALRIAKDPRFTRLACSHKGTYADGQDKELCDTSNEIELELMICRTLISSSLFVLFFSDCLVSRVTMHKWSDTPRVTCSFHLHALRSLRAFNIWRFQLMQSSRSSVFLCCSYMVATCDKDLKRRIRKVPGVPIMYITQHKFSIERFADVNDAPRQG